jgi:hypothetical protein
MKTWGLWAAGGVLLATLATDARATLLVANFNDLLTAGDLKGKGGGTGFSSTWGGSSTLQVVTGNLGSTLYNMPQLGTTLHVSGSNSGTSGGSSSSLRQEFRNTAASPTGTIWFSFLAKVEQSGDRAGLSINSPTATPFADPGTVYAYLEGSTLNYQFGTGTAGAVTNAQTVGTTALLVGRMTISDTGADAVSLWLNPDLIANPDITAYNPIYSSNAVDWIGSGGIGHVGVIAARKLNAASGAGHVDNLRFSDGDGDAAQAFRDVTGVPEPGGLLLLAGAGGALAIRRRRTARPQSQI